MKRTRKVFALVCIVAMVIGTGGILSAFAADKININKADAEALTQLKKIGPTIAARIVEYRVKNGPFKAPEDIMNVKGIGQKTYDGFKDQIVVK